MFHLPPNANRSMFCLAGNQPLSKQRHFWNSLFAINQLSSDPISEEQLPRIYQRDANSAFIVLINLWSVRVVRVVQLSGWSGYSLGQGAQVVRVVQVVQVVTDHRSGWSRWSRWSGWSGWSSLSMCFRWSRWSRWSMRSALMIRVQKIYVSHGLNQQIIEKSWDVTPVTN